ncbi:MAG: hypothetical protein OXC69_08710 [Candidatus Tectomicrobia bacterium]|nr:hypothetical protein [Candidatus Tectomicrobia bacterium]
MRFTKHAEQISGLRDTTYFHEHLGIWGHFSQWQRPDGSDRYWNAFGIARRSLRQNIVVEINPPPGGRLGNMQGVLATTGAGRRYLLHRGQMRIPGQHISETDFAAVTNLSTCTVTYSDGERVVCYPVANIDSDAGKLQEQIASFVIECNRVRNHYQFGNEFAEQQTTILQAEASSPELTGTYHVGPRAPQTIVRRHGKVWHKLAEALDSLGRKHTNQRVGGWGPDLITCDRETPVLFEIKVSITAADIQTAIGQLFIYEQLLGRNYRKVLVIPEKLSQRIASAVKSLSVEVLTFSQRNNSVRIDKTALKHLAR